MGYYDPALGRFINADNQVQTGNDLIGMNLFAYCGNDPVNRIDPTGEAWWHWALAAVVVVVAVVAVVVTAGGVAPALLAVGAVAMGMAAPIGGAAATVAAGVLIGSSLALGGAALVAASNSNSISDFNEQGDWWTVASTVAGAITGGLGGYGMAKSQNSPSNSSSVPNPNGKNGCAAHQAEIAKQTAKYDPKQVQVEVKINTPGGMKPYRYADFSVTQNGKTWYGNVGRALQSGLPCARERYAISDIQGAGGTIYFYPYN